MITNAFRRRLAGSALVAAACFKLASVLLWPVQGTPAVELRSAAAHPAAWTGASFLWLAFVACLGAGTLGLSGVVREGRGARLVQGASGVILVSMLAWGAMGVLGLQEVVLAQQPDRGAMVRLYTDMKHSSSLFVYVAMVLIGQLALAFLLAGLRRARAAALWQPLAMVAAIACDFAGDTRLLGAVESVLLFVALAPSGLRLLGTLPAHRRTAGRAVPAPAR